MLLSNLLCTLLYCEPWGQGRCSVMWGCSLLSVTWCHCQLVSLSLGVIVNWCHCQLQYRDAVNCVACD